MMKKWTNSDEDFHLFTCMYKNLKECGYGLFLSVYWIIKVKIRGKDKR